MNEARSARNERVLVVDDDPGVGESVSLLLESIGCQVELVTRGTEGLARAQSGEFDLLITDLRLPDRDGLSIIRSVKQAGIDLPMILMTSFSSIDTAIEALRGGALDYIIKPFSNADFRHAVERALDERRMRRENAMLKRNLKKAFSSNKIIGESAGIKRVFSLITKVANSDANVLIQGASVTPMAPISASETPVRAPRGRSCPSTAGLFPPIFSSRSCLATPGAPIPARLRQVKV